jgi:hypothetical protein
VGLDTLLLEEYVGSLVLLVLESLGDGCFATILGIPTLGTLLMVIEAPY